MLTGCFPSPCEGGIIDINMLYQSTCDVAFAFARCECTIWLRYTNHSPSRIIMFFEKKIYTIKYIAFIMNDHPLHYIIPVTMNNYVCTNQEVPVRYEFLLEPGNKMGNRQLLIIKFITLQGPYYLLLLRWS